MIEIERDGKVIHTSQNLRGVIEHARRVYVVSVHVEHDDKGRPISALDGGGYQVTFQFGNGDVCHTEFADWRVLVQWIKARRSWDMQRVGNWRWRANHAIDKYKRG